MALNTVKAPARATPQPDARGTVPTVSEAIALLERTRAGTRTLVGHLGAAELERSHSPIMGPLVWDLAHIAAYEDLWLCHRHGHRELLHEGLAALYDAFETPRALRNDEQAGLLDTAGANRFLDEVNVRACETLATVGVGDGTLLELVVRHELQHCETMRQTMEIAGLLPAGEPPALSIDPASARDAEREWLEVEAGPFAIGADADGFAYDNERPRHEAEVGAFAIDRYPLTNADWLRFCDDGGYERRELWSDAGWAWVLERRDEQPAGIWSSERSGRETADECLCHVSWFEAEALGRANDARLPHEAEWEKADTALGGLPGRGLVWEWTGDEFSGYPGFRAHPYREYSEVFFDRGYRVLRGASWATDPRVASPTFRNWDLPQRRQIFAGVRLAQDR